MRRKPKHQTLPFQYFHLFTFGSRQELAAAFGSIEAAERAWRSVRTEFLERWQLWGRPAAWWHFEPGVPDELRAGPHAILTDADAAEWHRLEQGRRRYLLSIGIDPAPPLPHVAFGDD